MTHKFLPAAIATALSSVLLATSSMAQEPQQIGVNAAVKGDVFVEGVIGGRTRAVIKQEVNLGDTVDSQSESALQILLLDETVFTVGPKCVLTIDEFVYNPNADASALSATLAKGAFRFMSGNISNGQGNVQLNTPVASMGVRGTIVEGIIGPDAVEMARKSGVLKDGDPFDPEGASVIFLRGPGRNGNGFDKRGDMTISSGGVDRRLRTSGSAVFVARADLPPSDPFMISQEQIQTFNIALRTRPSSSGPVDPFPIFSVVAASEDYEVEPVIDPTVSDPGPVEWPDVDCFVDLSVTQADVSGIAGNGPGPGPGPGEPLDPCIIDTQTQ